MITKPIDLNDIRLLMQVVEHGSLTATSRANGVPKSTISQRLLALERTVGVELLHRGSRILSLTQAGALLLPYAQEIEELVSKVELAVVSHHQQLTGTLRISCSKVLAELTLSPIVSKFLAQHPNVTVRVEATNRLVDIIAEGFDLALRGHVGPLKDSSLIQRVVAHAPWSIVASPTWIETNASPDSPGAIPPSQTLYFSVSNEFTNWSFTRGEEQVSVQILPRLVTDDMTAIRASAIAGSGITCLPTYVVSEAIHSGQLVSILPGWMPLSSIVSVLTPPKAQSSRLTGAFSDFLAKELPRIIRGGR